MMYEQTSLFPNLQYPRTCEEILTFWDHHIRQPEDEDDAISFVSIVTGYSFFIYGTKVFELKQSKTSSYLRLPGEFVKTLNLDSFKDKTIVDEKLYKINSLDESQLHLLVLYLISLKHRIFRALVTDTFACCNSFKQCSDAGHCLHENDRFYNGCYYRTNLEQGKIFYGKNKNM